MTSASPALPNVLVSHLRSWVGAWPPEDPPLIVANARNDEPGWDGSTHTLMGVADDAGRSVFGIRPALLDPALEPHFADIRAVQKGLPEAVGLPTHRIFRGVFRWSIDPAPWEDAGVWLPVDDERVPPWLKPFGGEVLVALDDDTYIAGVGIKKHDDFGNELAVVTDEAARGRGLGRRLVAQAARRVVDEGKVATYLHGPDNIGSARVAEASGFPDRGWSILGMFESDPGGQLTMKVREITTPQGEYLEVAVEWLPRHRSWARRFRAWQSKRDNRPRGDGWLELPSWVPYDLSELGWAIVAVVVVAVGVVLFWWVLLPLLLLVLDVVLVLLLVLVGVALRILFRRPWTITVTRAEEVIASRDVVGWKRALRTRDAIADDVANGRVTAAQLPLVVYS